MRDPTRGGLATALVELAIGTPCNFVIEESAIPVQEPVAALCDVLGLDPLHLACEGRLIAIVAPDALKLALDAMRRHPLGRQAACIGRVEEGSGEVHLRTVVGGTRPLDLLEGEQLPRIC